MTDRPRIAVYGCGAVGGYVGGYLTRDGHDVTMFDPWDAHVAAMREPGLRLQGLTDPENFNVKTDAHLFSEIATHAPFDIVFISVKSYDTAAAAKAVGPQLSPDGVAVSLQNGINEFTIAEILGAARTVGCIASQISVALPGPGHVERRVKLGGDAHTVFRVGEMDGAVTPRVELIAEMLGGIDSARATDNLMGERWSKLATNAMRNPTSAATGLATNDCDRDDHIRAVTLRLGAEAIAVAKAEGARLVRILGLDAELIHAAGTGDPDAGREVTEKLLAGTQKRSDSQRPSMGQDVLKGRKTEIDFINGLVVERAKALGIATPVNAAIVEIVKGVETGNVTPAPDILKDL